MKEITVLDVVLALIACGFVVSIGLTLRELGVHRPKRRRNAPAPRPHRPPRPEPEPDLKGLVVCGSWPVNPGDRVRILVHVPEYEIEIGHAATCEAVWPGDDVMYRFKLDGRYGRESVITFFEHELWQLERIHA